MPDYELTTITDEYMREMRARAKNYCLVVLKAGPGMSRPGAEKTIWEHGRRNFALLADGVLSVVCPVADDSELSGIYLFDATVDRVRAIMDADPGVRAGIFIYEIHACRGFPGACLP